MKTWLFFQNPFLHATDNSFFIALAISDYHDSALARMKADPFILLLYNYYHPLHVAYKDAYSAWETLGGTQQGETLNLMQLLRLLSKTKIRQWDRRIQEHYEPDTPAYKRLLPNHRQPFQSGTQVERIQTVKSLIDAIGTDEALTAVKTDAENLYALLDAAYIVQKGNKTSAKSATARLETARQAMCIGQYANLGGLIQKYPASPEIMAQYFDLQAIRRNRQVSFTGQLKPGEVYTIVKHTFGEDDEVVLSNNGTTSLKFYLANTKDAQPGAKSVTLDGGEQTVLASALGNLTDTYLCVLNTNPQYAGEFGVDLV